MTLLDFLKPNLIKVGLEGTEKEEIIEELLELMVREGAVKNREKALQAIYEREAKGSTGIGKGVAIPHGKDDSVGGVVLSIGTSKEGIEFDAIDGELVHLIFLVLADSENPRAHVSLLADIARCLLVPGAYRKLCEAPTPEELIRLFMEEIF